MAINHYCFVQKSVDFELFYFVLDFGFFPSTCVEHLLHTHLMFFWLEAGGEVSHPSLQHWAGGLDLGNPLDSSFPWLSPVSRVGNTIPKDGIGEVWERNDDFFFIFFFW